jgi:hypothetical protein
LPAGLWVTELWAFCSLLICKNLGFWFHPLAHFISL